jgi:hypothetical protein
MFLLLQELYTSKCVYHVSEQAFTMSPVYTEGGLAPALPAFSAKRGWRQTGGEH